MAGRCNWRAGQSVHEAGFADSRPAEQTHGERTLRNGFQTANEFPGLFEEANLLLLGTGKKRPLQDHAPESVEIPPKHPNEIGHEMPPGTFVMGRAPRATAPRGFRDLKMGTFHSLTIHKELQSSWRGVGPYSCRLRRAHKPCHANRSPQRNLHRTLVSTLISHVRLMKLDRLHGLLAHADVEHFHNHRECHGKIDVASWHMVFEPVSD